jgi:hypothetical protein
MEEEAETAFNQIIITNALNNFFSDSFYVQHGAKFATRGKSITE